ncbi:hypothetical protein [Pedobacter sp.]|uniref:hypothetical protein n=1 Tax=Pedobacter sp. TaxID=1411316 RepID=UPI003BAC75F9
MSNVLFLSNPSLQHVNSELNLASTLINQGEKITFFSSIKFKKSISYLGAKFKRYRTGLNVFNNLSEKTDYPTNGLISALLEPMKFIDDILEQIKDLTFDYVIFSATFPFANVIAQKLDIPTMVNRVEEPAATLVPDTIELNVAALNEAVTNY